MYLAEGVSSEPKDGSPLTGCRTYRSTLVLVLAAGDELFGA